jgi:hypothetical protein
LPFLDGKGRVLVGELDGRVWDKELARNRSHGLQDSLIDDPASGDLVLDHAPPLVRESLHATDPPRHARPPGKRGWPRSPVHGAAAAGLGKDPHPSLSISTAIVVPRSHES